MESEKARPCPVCRYELAATIEAGRNRCPECGWQFTAKDLWVLFEKADAAGMPRSLSPHERRLSGRKLVLGFLALVMLLAGIATWLGLATMDQLGSHEFQHAPGPVE